MVPSCERSKVSWSALSASSWLPTIEDRGDVAAVDHFLRNGFASGDQEPEHRPIFVPQIDPDPEAPTPHDPDYDRMHQIRNGERHNGQPLGWGEIRERIAREKEVMAKWG
jgi:hypothetical protein